MKNPKILLVVVVEKEAKEPLKKSFFVISEEKVESEYENTYAWLASSISDGDDLLPGVFGNFQESSYCVKKAEPGKVTRFIELSGVNKLQGLYDIACKSANVEVLNDTANGVCYVPKFNDLANVKTFLSSLNISGYSVNVSSNVITMTLGGYSLCVEVAPKNLTADDISIIATSHLGFVRGVVKRDATTIGATKVIIRKASAKAKNDKTSADENEIDTKEVNADIENVDIKA